MKKIYSFESGLSEREFLEREFNLELTEIEPHNVKEILQFDTYFLATSKVKEVEYLISESKNNSVIIFLFGNETYNVSEFNYLNNYSHKIKFGFFQMLPSKADVSVYLKLVPFSIYDGALAFNNGSNFFRQLKNGFDLMKRTRKIDIKFPITYFPMGYTNRFVKELKIKFPNLTSKSLVDQKFTEEDHKNKFISFVGQESNWNRNFSLKILKKFSGNSQIKITEGWSGINQDENTEYIDSLLESKYVWCPPGNISNLSFRYLESLLCGAVPLTTPSTLQDPHLWNSWVQFNSYKLFSWRNLLKFAENLGNVERLSIKNFALDTEINVIYQIRNLINEMNN